MPDPKQMSGIPRPVDDLPNGTVSVRARFAAISRTTSPISRCELHVGDKVQTVEHRRRGARASSTTCRPATTVKAVAVVDGERLESQEFPVQPQGGIRLLLVATDKEKAQQAGGAARAGRAPARWCIGGESRIVIEPGDEDAVASTTSSTS